MLGISHSVYLSMHKGSRGLLPHVTGAERMSLQPHVTVQMDSHCVNVQADYTSSRILITGSYLFVKYNYHSLNKSKSLPGGETLPSLNTYIQVVLAIIY